LPTRAKRKKGEEYQQWQLVLKGEEQIWGLLLKGGRFGKNAEDLRASSWQKGVGRNRSCYLGEIWVWQGGGGCMGPSKRGEGSHGGNKGGPYQMSASWSSHRRKRSKD